MGNTNDLNPSANRSFLEGWVFANIVGLPVLLLPYGIGFAVSMSLAIMSDGTAVGLSWDIFIFMVLALSGAVLGAWLGWMQSLSLKAQIVSGKWIRASSFGVAIGTPIGWLAYGLFLDSPMVQPPDGNYIYGSVYFSVGYAYLIFGVVLGLTIGVAQWSVLRQQVHGAGWWMIGLPVCFTLGVAFANFYLSEVLGFWAVFSALTALVGVGCITGILLRWLFQFPKVQREGQ